MKHVPRFAKRIRARRRTGLFAATTVAMLAITGGALAWHGGFSSATPVSATFSANTVANSQSQTCNATNNDSIQVTEATFTGTASSADTHLTGPVTIHATSVYDATTNAGTVSGDLMIGTGFEGRFLTVNIHGGLQGMLVGFENGGGQLTGNLSSSFSTTGGFGSSSSLATIGSGSGTNTAIVSTGSCAPASNDNDNDDDQGENNFSGSLGKFSDSGNFSGKFGGLGGFTGFSSGHHQGGGDSQD
jgi:hypothetical protein